MGPRATRALLLVECVASSGAKPGPTLEIGAGTGTNAIWMAERGFDVLEVDVSPLASKKPGLRWKRFLFLVALKHWIFTQGLPPGGPFPFVCDRGRFHVFDEPDERQRFAARVAATQAPGGFWLSLIGKSEGPVH